MEFDMGHIAKLAKLRIPDDKLKSFTEEMRDIVKMVENLPPMESVDALLDPADTMVLRADTVRPSTPREDILLNAPKTAEGCFLVPKTVD